MSEQEIRNFQDASLQLSTHMFAQPCSQFPRQHIDNELIEGIGANDVMSRLIPTAGGRLPERRRSSSGNDISL